MNCSKNVQEYRIKFGVNSQRKANRSSIAGYIKINCEIRYPNFNVLKLFPASAYIQLEFDKIKSLLLEHCSNEYAKEKAQELQIYTNKESIETELRQSHEYKQLLSTATSFPNDYTLNLSKELKLLGIPGAVLAGEQFIQLRRLAESIEKIFRWFDNERKTAYPGLTKVIRGTYYEKVILKLIDDVLDGQG